MGGCEHAQGNSSPGNDSCAAEFNFKKDPEAANIVLDSFSRHLSHDASLGVQPRPLLLCYSAALLLYCCFTYRCLLFYHCFISTLQLLYSSLDASTLGVQDREAPPKIMLVPWECTLRSALEWQVIFF
jgi:hypothetical protein